MYYFAVFVVGCGKGGAIVALAALKNRLSMCERCDRPRVCSARDGNGPCTHLAVPGALHCRGHLAEYL